MFLFRKVILIFFIQKKTRNIDTENELQSLYFQNRLFPNPLLPMIQWNISFYIRLALHLKILKVTFPYRIRQQESMLIIWSSAHVQRAFTCSWRTKLKISEGKKRSIDEMKLNPSSELNELQQIDIHSGNAIFRYNSTAALIN